jgi:ribonuclease BN (tRNA processing enzyme)
VPLFLIGSYFDISVKILVLTHFVSSDDPSLTDEDWVEGTRTHFDRKIIVGKDLLEIY